VAAKVRRFAAKGVALVLRLHPSFSRWGQREGKIVDRSAFLGIFSHISGDRENGIAPARAMGEHVAEPGFKSCRIRDVAIQHRFFEPVRIGKGPDRIRR